MGDATRAPTTALRKSVGSRSTSERDRTGCCEENRSE